jgi:hypothetical protein
MKKYILIILFNLCVLLPSQSYSQLIFAENFSSGVLPVGWTNDSLGLPALNVWLFNNPYGRSITGANFDSTFAIFDSDEGGVDDSIDEKASLITYDIDISSASVSLFLELDQQYQGINGPDGSTRTIEISTDGINWTVVESSQADIGFPNPAMHSVYDISSVLPSTNLKIKFTYEGSWDFWWAIDNVMVISRQPCTAPPNAGITISTMVSVCEIDSFYLSLLGVDHGTDLMFQWQSSLDSLNWNDMMNDTLNSTYSFQTTGSYYRCAVTCSGQTAYSTPVFVDMNNSTTCYCVGINSLGCDVLDKVIFHEINNVGSDCNGNPNFYIHYPDTGLTTTTVKADSTYDLTIASGTGPGNHSAAAWFDFNQDGDFQDVNEFFHISDSIDENSSDITTSVTIPSSAYGVVRMRIRYIGDSSIGQTNDCDTFSFGETEDYSIFITNGNINVEDVLLNNIQIYPNPVSKYLNISSGNIKDKIILSLFDHLGRIWLEQITNISETKLDVSNLSGGFYLLSVETGQGRITRKILVVE